MVLKSKKRIITPYFYIKKNGKSVSVSLHKRTYHYNIKNQQKQILVPNIKSPILKKKINKPKLKEKAITLLKNLKSGDTIKGTFNKPIIIEKIMNKFFTGRFKGENKLWKFNLSTIKIDNIPIEYLLSEKEIQSIRKQVTPKQNKQKVIEPKPKDIIYIKNPLIKIDKTEIPSIKLIRDSKKEHVIVLDQNDKILLHVTGNRTEVRIKPTLVDFILNHKPRTLVDLHNHIYERPPSPKDIYTFLTTPQIDKAFVVTKNKTLYMMKKTPKTQEDPKKIGSNLSSFVKKADYYDHARQIVISEKLKNKTISDYKLQVELWKYLAKKFNFEVGSKKLK